MFIARITGLWDQATIEAQEIGSFRTGGEAFKVLKATLAANDKIFSGDVFALNNNRVMFTATNPCPEWVR